MDSLGDKTWGLVGRSVQKAHRHNVAALLHRLKPREATDSERHSFASAYRKTLAQNLLFLETTRDLLEVFEKAKISVMPLKGVLLASCFYKDIGVRPQSDVDLLVHEEDLELAHRSLIEQGFGEAWPRAFYQDHYHWVYHRGSMLLELHWALKAPGTCSPNLTRIWNQARWRLAECVEFLEMAPEDLLTYLAVNKAHQRFPALLDYVDLAKIIQHSSLDWDRFCQEALKDKTAGPVWFGLSVAKDLLDVPVPDEALRTLSKPFHARLSVFLKKFLGLFGGPLCLSPEQLEGPTGRLYESFMEGRPSAIFHLIRPLLFPSRARVGVLAKGSYPRYYYNQLRRLLDQVTRS